MVSDGQAAGPQTPEPWGRPAGGRGRVLGAGHVGAGGWDGDPAFLWGGAACVLTALSSPLLSGLPREDRPAWSPRGGGASGTSASGERDPDLEPGPCPSPFPGWGAGHVGGWRLGTWGAGHVGGWGWSSGAELRVFPGPVLIFLAQRRGGSPTGCRWCRCSSRGLHGAGWGDPAALGRGAGVLGGILGWPGGLLWAQWNERLRL